MEYNFSFSLNKDDIFKSSINYMRYQKTFYFDIFFTFVAFIALLYTVITGNFIKMTNFKKVLLIFAVLIFPVIQPTIIYIKSCNRAKILNNKIINISFDDVKMHINIDAENTDVLYENIYNVINYRNMIVVMYDSIHGQIMPERIFEGKKDIFYNFIKNRIDEARIKQKNSEEKNNK